MAILNPNTLSADASIDMEHLYQSLVYLSNKNGYGRITPTEFNRMFPSIEDDLFNKLLDRNTNNPNRFFLTCKVYKIKIIRSELFGHFR